MNDGWWIVFYVGWFIFCFMVGLLGTYAIGEHIRHRSWLSSEKRRRALDRQLRNPDAD